jgi:hypothetical protein
MTQSKVDRLWRAYTRQLHSITLCRWLGYGLLLLALLDFIAILIPLDLMNPVWEFRSIGALVERTPVLLIGLVMVFWGEEDYRHPREKWILKGLTWVTIIISIGLLVLIPLCFVNSIRIHQLKIEEVNRFREGNLALVKQLEDKLNQTNSVEEMQLLLNRGFTSRSPIVLDVNQPLTVVKAEIPTLLEPVKSGIDRQAQAALKSAKNEQPGLLKQSIKSALGALIAAVICIRIWQSTLWVRKTPIL